MTDRKRRAGRPFLKWAGGKGQLTDRILAVAPERCRTYCEPFVGGGAVFFAMAAEGRFQRAVLADRSLELTLAYRAVRDDVDSVIRELGRHAASYRANGAGYYYEVRAWTPLLPADRAARLIFLNKTGFNGLYRVNRRGQFNVPHGRYRNPSICDEPRLRGAAAALQGVEIKSADFADTVAGASPGDFVYFDPPYVPVSRTSSFTAYASDDFSDGEQMRLAALFRELSSRGVSVLLSNSDCPFTRTLYAGLPIERVLVPRAINSVASRRGPVSELLVGSSKGETDGQDTRSDRRSTEAARIPDHEPAGRAGRKKRRLGPRAGPGTGSPRRPSVRREERG